MSYTHLSKNVVNIRKPHKCVCCAQKTEPPAKMTYNTGIYEGVFQTTYTCPICELFMTAERWKEIDNEIGEGDIWEFEEYKQFREQHVNQTKNE